MINIIAVSLMSLWSFALRETTMDMLMPPLVAQVRKKVKRPFATAAMQV